MAQYTIIQSNKVNIAAKNSRKLDGNSDQG
jgi:hypothetical protein